MSEKQPENSPQPSSSAGAWLCLLALGLGLTALLISQYAVRMSLEASRRGWEINNQNNQLRMQQLQQQQRQPPRHGQPYR